MNTLKQEYGAFLNQFKWDWFVTLTFKNPVTSRQASKRFNRWKVQLKKTTGNKIQYVMITESNRYRDNTHLHLLISGIKNEKAYIWKDKWIKTNGFAQINKYIPSFGANYYLGDKMVKEHSQVILSRDLIEVKKGNSN